MKNEPCSIRDAFRASAVLVEEQEFIRIFSLEWNEREYRVFCPKSKTTKLTEIECRGNTVIFRKKPWNGWLTGLRGQTMEWFRFQIPAFDPNIRFLLLIPGIPGVIQGLDEGIFNSCHKPPENGKISVMTQRAFKTFCPTA